MKFLYVGPFRFPTGDAAASRVLNNIRILRALGHEVRVLSFGGEFTGHWEVFDEIPYYVTADIDTHSWKERLNRYVCPYVKARKMLPNLYEGTDAIICYNPGFHTSLWLLSLCKKKDLKLIADITEWYCAREMPGGRFTPVYWMSEYNMKHIQKKIQNKILISQYLFNYYNNATSNNMIVPPLINMADKKWNVQEFAYPDTISQFDGIKILYSGTPNNKDLLGNLISAILRILKDSDAIQLIVAGVSAQNVSQFFDNEKDYLHNKKHFVFLGRIPQDDVPAYYKISDFSAIIRKSTRKNMAGFPTKMAESMAAGCPVIANVFSDLGDYIIEGDNSIVLNGTSVEDIYDGLQRILPMSKEKIAEMKDSAKSYGKRLFDYRNFIHSFENFINQMK